MSQDYEINQEAAEPISRLDRRSSCVSSDFYILSRSSGDEAFSYRTTYGDILYRVISEISAKFGFESMAFCDKSDFAEFDHLHGYSYSNCYPAEYRENAGQSCIMTVYFSDESRSGQLSVFSPPLPVQPQPREPALGEVRFLALSSIEEQYDATFSNNQYSLRNPHTGILKNIAEGTFDGWVYPDGSEYLQHFGKYDFSAAYKIYGGVNGKFTVPVLSNFIRPNNGEFLFDSIRKMPAQVGIPQHKHNFLSEQELAKVLSISATVTMRQAKYGGNNQKYLHAAKVHGQAYKATKILADNISTDLDIDSSVIYYENSSGDETYPGHRLVPVQIYIGRTQLP